MTTEVMGVPLSDDVPVRRRVGLRENATRERQERILDAAVLAFAERGFHGTSLRDVAARAGLSQSGLLHHYPEKTALLEAVLDRRTARSEERFGWRHTDGISFVRNVIRVAGEESAETARSEVELIATLTAEATSRTHPAHGYFVALYATLRDGVTRAFADLAARGLLRPDVDPATAAVSLLGLSDGLRTQWLLDPGTDPAAALTAHLDSLLVQPLETL